MTTAPMTGGGSLPEAEARSIGQSSWERWFPLGGILFAVLLIAGFFVAGSTPDNAKPQEWTTFYADSGNRMQQVIGAYLLVIATFAFLWFMTGIIQRMRAFDSGEVSYRTLLAGASGLLTVLFLFAFAIIQVSVSASVSFGSAPVPSPDFGIQFEQLAYGLMLIPGLLCAALFITLTSVSALSSGMYGRWLAWLGIVFAVLLLLGPAFFPMLLFPLWALIAGVVLLVRSS